MWRSLLLFLSLPPGKHQLQEHVVGAPLAVACWSNCKCYTSQIERKGMKSFFKRLSTKKDKQQEINPHSSPNKSSWPSVSLNSFPVTVHGSCSKPASQEFQQNNTPTPQQQVNLTVQQHHKQTEAGSVSNPPLHISAPEAQASPSHPNQAQSMVQGDTPALQLPNGREAITSSSAPATTTKLPSHSTPLDFAVQNSASLPKQEPASIYKSHNELDIMGSETFDFSQNHLLSSTPDADWLNEDRVSHTLPDRPSTARETPHNRISHDWVTQPMRASSTHVQPAPKPSKAKRPIPHSPAYSYPDESARPRTLPYNGSVPRGAKQGADQPPVNQPMVTPFAKYSTKAMSGPLTSADLDTAMRVNGQMPVRSQQEPSYYGQAGKQHMHWLTHSGCLPPTERMCMHHYCVCFDV